MRHLIPFVALLAIAGCDAHDGRTSRLELVVNQTRFTAGDEALLVLDNDTGQEQSYGPCLVLIGLDANTPRPDDPACLDVLAIIQPGQSVPFRYQLPATLAAGTYVIALDRGEPGSIRTGRFEVIPAE
ncbi:MAG TPA: hypothetical protein VGB53_12095 [Rubricoccaceae bacterium]|jgi:hypothetical protein